MPGATVTSHGSTSMNPCRIASTNGGHCLTVRISRPCTGEATRGAIARSQSGSAARAGIGRGRKSISAGSQRKVIFIG